MKQKTEIIIYTICTVALLWLILSWIDICIHNGNHNPKYGKWNILVWVMETETENNSCTVVACEPTNGNYRITIEDAKGNLWAYYDGDTREIGESIEPIWSENGNEIIGINGGN